MAESGEPRVGDGVNPTHGLEDVEPLVQAITQAGSQEAFSAAVQQACVQLEGWDARQQAHFYTNLIVAHDGRREWLLITLGAIMGRLLFREQGRLLAQSGEGTTDQ